jgi:hypothetical protein
VGDLYRESPPGPEKREGADMRRTLIVAILAFAVAVGSVGADGLKDFLQQFCTHLNNLDKNYSKVGQNLGANIKAGGLKGALQGMCADMMAADKANEADRQATIAAFKKAIHDIIFFIPDTIKKIWDAFVGLLGKIFDAGAGTGGNGAQAPGASFGAKASDTDVTAKMEVFLSGQTDLGTRLAAWLEYRKALMKLQSDVDAYMQRDDATVAKESNVSASDVAKGKDELSGKVAASTEVAERMETILARDIAAGGAPAMDVYTQFRQGLDRTDRFSVLPALNMKVLEQKK